MIRLKDLRNQKGLSQKEVAEYLGISQPAYANYERQAREADYDTLKKLSDYFNVSVDYLLGRTEQKQNDDITFDDFTYAMYNESKELTEDQKDILISMAKTLKGRLKKDGKI